MLRLQSPAYLAAAPRGGHPRRLAADRWHRRRWGWPLLPLRAQWKQPHLDAGVLDRVKSWLSRAQEVLANTSAAVVPLVSLAVRQKRKGNEQEKDAALEERNDEAMLVKVPETTLQWQIASWHLSLDAIIAIEEFGRLNGLTGRKLLNDFHSLAPEPVQSDARNFIEYCCFCFLTKDSSAVHPCLKEPEFQRLVFVTMLAWEQPYCNSVGTQFPLGYYYSLQGRLVREEAFVRIAPAVAGVSDISTAHHLYKSLVGDGDGLSLEVWTKYISELLRVHQGRSTYRPIEAVFPGEQLLCIGSSRKGPVLKWEDNMAWPGSLTLTDKALYFEAIGLTGDTKKPLRLDLTHQGSRIVKAKVGPFGSKLFDSAVSVTSGSMSEVWVLEFIDFGREMRRDVWHAFISEVISLYKFICEYGPSDDDQDIHHVYGADRGKRKVVMSAANSIARLQSLQFIKKLHEDPAKLVQFSYLSNAPYGDVVLQTLAVHFWSGSLVGSGSKHFSYRPQLLRTDELSAGFHLYDVDGSVYLHKWMTSPTWKSSQSVAFWRNNVVRQGGIVLGKSLVVAERNLIERSVVTCRERSQIVEKTRATIVAATIEGIPSNIDLFKELMLPLVIIAQKLNKLRRWEQPHLSAMSVFFLSTVIFADLLQYALPAALTITAVAMLLIKSLKEQGRLGRAFGTVMIQDRPPSSTLRKIRAVQEAMAALESFLQGVNVALLKTRTIVLGGQPEATVKISAVLLASAMVLLIVPFKCLLAFLVLDQFTRELKFRRAMAVKFISFLKEQWATVPATPVVILPHEASETSTKRSTATEVSTVAQTRLDDTWKGQSAIDSYGL